MFEKQNQLRAKILEFARGNEDIRLVVETGAFARKEPPADELSDLDIELFTRNPQLLLCSQNWLREFGAVVICLELENQGFNPTRLVIFENGAKVDFSIYNLALLEEAFRSEPQRRGYQVLLDKDGWTRNWRALAPATFSPPTEKEWRQMIDDFWFEAFNTAKYLARGDLWHAKVRDFEVKGYLLQMLDWHAGGQGSDVWHLGHFLQMRTDEATWNQLAKTWATMNATDSCVALAAMLDVFSQTARAVAGQQGFNYPGDVETQIRAFIEAMDSRPSAFKQADGL